MIAHEGAVHSTSTQAGSRRNNSTFQSSTARNRKRRYSSMTRSLHTQHSTAVPQTTNNTQKGETTTGKALYPPHQYNGPRKQKMQAVPQHAKHKQDYGR